MSDVPFYPTWLVRQKGMSWKKLGDARYVTMGWTLLFKDGELRISTPGGVNAIHMGEQTTEEFVAIVRAIDQGRHDHVDFEVIRPEAA